MEPIGTITVYLPFMDSQTKNVITSLMRDAYNFHDFVKSLCQKVSTTDSPGSLVFFAVHFAALLFDFESLDKIAKSYGKLDLIRPNLFYGSAMQGRSEDMKKVRDAADQVLSSNPPDWLVLEMHIVKLEAENEEYPANIYDHSTGDKIEQLIEDKPEFEFLKSRIYDSLTIRAIRDGDEDGALELNQMAIENAEKFDDINRLAHLLRTRAELIHSSNWTEMLDLLVRSQRLMSAMGDKNGLADVFFQLSKLESTRGLYDNAIEHNLECIRIRESIGVSTGIFALTISTLYNVIGQSEAGFEWAKLAENESTNRPTMQTRAVLNQAWSCTLQKRFAEAHLLLDETRESIFKSGLESNLAWFYFIGSIIEAAEEDFSRAAANVEEALDIYERSGGFVSYYICLHHRAKIEIMSEQGKSYVGVKNATGPWLSLLEERARTEDLPGILGQALLLKTRLFAAEGVHENAMNVLSELIELVQANNLDFLKQATDYMIESLK